MENVIGTNTGHGHVWERPDGEKARCGGPGMCPECNRDAARVGLIQSQTDKSKVQEDNRKAFEASLLRRVNGKYESEAVEALWASWNS